MQPLEIISKERLVSSKVQEIIDINEGIYLLVVSLCNPLLVIMFKYYKCYL